VAKSLNSHKKILIVRADDLRHRALTASLTHSGFLVSEIVIPKHDIDRRIDSLAEQHFAARIQVEKDFFQYLDLEKRSLSSGQFFSKDVNGNESLSFAKEFKPDFVITFGCPILDRKWISSFPDKILGVHLGLSPYYRGSGTNFFPVVNNEIGAIGYTLMNLDEGIDTGAIFHQQYANVVLGDSIHTIGTRLMQSMFQDIAKILMVYESLEDAIAQDLKLPSRNYQLKHFTKDALRMAYDNLRNGAIEYFLDNRDEQRSQFPLIKQAII
jgi:methionyl-tRNA formyltransferase